MIQWKRQKLVLSRAGRHRVAVDFSGGRLSRNDGLLFVREIDRKLGLLDAAHQAIPNPATRPRTCTSSGSCWPSGSLPWPPATKTATTIKTCRATEQLRATGAIGEQHQLLITIGFRPTVRNPTDASRERSV